jgi:transcriptional regulator with XRE-family HTH domain
VKATANTISRWETATYKPSISDLERLAQFFNVPIAIFFPPAQAKSRANVLCATADRDDDDLEEIMLYAQFRKARHRAKGRR